MVKIMRKILLLLALFAMLLLFSCESTSGPRFKGEVYSLSALLVAGQPLNEEHPVYLTRSSEIEDFNYLQIFVTDAKITLRDLTSGQEFTLQPGMAGILPAYLDPEQRLIEAEHCYRIEARIPGYQPVIWAETTVPQAITLETDVYGNNADGEGYSFDEQTQNQMPFNRIDSDFPLVLNTGQIAGNYNFFSEFYCLEEFSTDLEYTTQIMGMVHPDASMEETYNSSGETIRRISSAVRFRSGPQQGLPDNYIMLRGYSQVFMFYGRYRIKSYILDDNYYNYVNMPEGYLYGGVHNALGYFGSASGGVMYVTICK